MSRTGGLIYKAKRELAEAERDYKSAVGRVRDAEVALKEAEIWRDRCATEVEELTDLLARFGEGTKA